MSCLFCIYLYGGCMYWVLWLVTTKEDKQAEWPAWSNLKRIESSSQCHAMSSFQTCFHKLSIMFFYHVLSYLTYLLFWTWMTCRWGAQTKVRLLRESGAARDPRHSQTFPDSMGWDKNWKSTELNPVEPSWTYCSVNVTHWPRSLCLDVYEFLVCSYHPNCLLIFTTVFVLATTFSGVLCNWRILEGFETPWTNLTSPHWVDQDCPRFSMFSLGFV